MSKKANKVKRAEKAALELARAAAAAAAAAKAAEPVLPPKPPGKKAILIAAKKAGVRQSSRLAVLRDKPAARPEAGNTPTAWAGPATTRSTTRAVAGRLMTAEIVTRFRAAIGSPDENALALK